MPRVPRHFLRLLVPCALFLAASREAAGGEPFLVRAWQSEDGLPSNAVRSVAQAADGYLWVGTAEGIVRFDGVRFAGFEGEPDAALARLPVRLLFPLANGDVWATASSGRLLRVRGGRLAEVRMPGGAADGLPAPGRVISQIVEQPGGGVLIIRGAETWLAAGDAEPRAIERTAEVDSLLRAEAEQWAQRGRARPDGRGLGLRDAAGREWTFTSEAGLAVARTGAPSSSAELRPPEPPKSVNELHEDREGNLWLATPSQGLWRLRPPRVEVLTTADGLSDRTALVVLEDRAGAIWVGTAAGGLDKLVDGKRAAHFEVGTPSGRAVSALCETRDGIMWAATREGSVFRQTDGVFTTMFPVASGATKVVAIVEDGAGRLWFGGRLGLTMWDGAALQPIDLGSTRNVTALASGGAEVIWVGTESGQIFRGGAGGLGPAMVGLGRPISSLLPDPDGGLWAGTLGGGLVRVRDGRAFELDARKGVEAARVTYVLDDRAGHLWLGSLRGIFRLRKDELGEVESGRRDVVSALLLDRSDGLLTRECTGGVQPAGWRGRNGILWFPTSNGLARVRPGEIAVDGAPPPVVIEELRANGRTIPAGAALAGPGRSRLEFRYTALSFSAPEKVRFRTRLEGLEDEWRDAGSQRTVAYEAVPPGRYRFRVLAANGDGVWNETGATLALRVVPHFWQTLWFKIALTLAAAASAVGIGAAVSRARLRGRLLRAEAKSAREAERARIAQDLHDDLGASLTEISLLANLAAEERRPRDGGNDALPEIAGKAQSLVGALDEIVWAVNPRHDTLGSLAEYLSAFASEFLGNAGIALRLDVPRELPAVSLDAERRHSVFLAAREALNNAVKHSRAAEVWLRMRFDGEQLEVAVEDDGRGFSLDATGTGDGVGNLRARLERLGGECRIETGEGAGTRVLLRVPLR